MSAELGLGLLLLLLLGVAGGLLYRQGGAGKRRQKERADAAEEEAERLAGPRAHGRKLSRVLRGKGRKS